MILYYCHCGVFSLKRHVIACEHRESLMLATLGTMEGTFSRKKYDLLWSYACHEMSVYVIQSLETKMSLNKLKFSHGIEQKS